MLWFIEKEKSWTRISVVELEQLNNLLVDENPVLWGRSAQFLLMTAAVKGSDIRVIHWCSNNL
jgi:hypothetical protein